MSTKDLILTRSADILELATKVLLHKKRIATLCKRVGVITDIIKTDEGTPKDSQIMDSLTATLEEIKDYVNICSSKDALIANRIILYGSDAEQFVKWNERFQHFIESLGHCDTIPSFFDENIDMQDYEDDLTLLKKSLPEILGLVVNGKDVTHSDRLVKSVDSWIVHQSNIRSTFQTKTSPTAALEIDPATIKYENLIGKGVFGEVWKAKYEGSNIAVKMIPLESLSKQSLETLKTEVSIMRKLAHTRIVSCFGIFQLNGNQCVAMELMGLGSLQEYMHLKPCPEGWLKREKIALDICTGMSYLHRLNVVHKYLKPGNVVLDEYLRAKITDFGMSVVKDTAVTAMKGTEKDTVQYMAPECFGLSPHFTAKSDVYSFAIILWELAHWKFAYAGFKIQDIRDAIRANNRMEINPEIPRSISKLITTCWDANPKSRLDFRTLGKMFEADVIVLHLSTTPIFSGSETSLSSDPIVTKLASKVLSLPKLTNEFESKSNLINDAVTKPSLTNRQSEKDSGSKKPQKSPDFQTRYTKKRMWLLFAAIIILALIAGGVVVLVVYILPQQRNAFDTEAALTLRSSQIVLNPSRTDSISSSVNTDSITLEKSIVSSITSPTTLVPLFATGTTVETTNFSATKSSTTKTLTTKTLTTKTLTTKTLTTKTTTSQVLPTITMVSTLAGSGSTRSTDGYNLSASFGSVYGICFRSSDNTVFFTDWDNGDIRAIDSTGYVSTLVRGSRSSFDGPISSARFEGPYGIIEENGAIFVSENQNGLLRKIQNGAVATIAGNSGAGGVADGTGSAAQFGTLYYISADGNGNIYTTDGFNRIRRVNSVGTVVTLAGSAGSGNVVGAGNVAKFDAPRGIVFDRTSNVAYIADSNNNCIKKMTAEGFVSVVTGGTSGFRDGNSTVARFNGPRGIALDGNRNLIIADNGNNRIRRLNLVTMQVTTIAGTGAAGLTNGAGNVAKFDSPSSVAIDQNGSILVADLNNYAIRKISFSLQ